MTGFVGRTGDLERVAALLDDHRVVTITGPGGIGKTRLAAEVLRPRRDAGEPVVVAALAELPEETTADAIAASLSMSAPEAVAMSMGATPGVLVLDSCEHLLDAARAFVRRVLAASDTVSVLATSREPLRIPDEVLSPLAPLGLPGPGAPDIVGSPAVSLFVDRARAAGAEWPLSDSTLAAIAALCARVDALPLAIELAAGRARALTPTELLDLMTDRLHFLESEGRDGPDRHRSVRAAIAVSTAPLGPDAHRSFRRLAVFPESFDLALAHAVTAETDDVLDTVGRLADLVDRSLLVAEPRGDATRYRMLELVRDFADAELHGHGEWDAVHERFIATMVTVADDIVAEGIQRWSGAVVGRVAAQAGNLIRASDWCIEHDATPERSLRMFVPLFGVVHQGRAEQVRAAGERLFARWPHAEAPWRGEALAVLATGMAMATEPERAVELARAALGSAGVTEIGTVIAHRALALAAIGQGAWARASAEVERACMVASAVPLPPFTRELLAFQALLLHRIGDSEAATELLGRALEDSDVAHDPITEVWALVAAATNAGWEDRWEDVGALVDRARAVAAPLADGWWDGAIFRSDAHLAAYEAAAVALVEGWEPSVPAWVAALERAAARGELRTVALTVRAASSVAGRLGRHDLGRRLAGTIPPTRELDVVPTPFVIETVPAKSGPLTAILRDVVSALRDSVSSEAPIEATAATPDATARITRAGDGWEVVFRSSVAHVRDLKGLHDLAVLLVRPGKEVHCLELMGAADVGRAPGPSIDSQARAEYKTRIVDLQDEIEQAREDNDAGRAAGAERELDALVDQLTGAFGLTGHDRDAGSSVERARSAVTYRIRAAVRKIAQVHPDLGRHLTNAVRTGAWCSYQPESPIAWEVETS